MFHDFGRIIEDELVEDNMSMADLSRRLGQPESTLRRIHIGDSGPTLRSLIKMAPRMSDKMFERLISLLKGARGQRGMHC